MSVPERTFAILEQQLDAGAAVQPAMAAMFDACSTERPHDDWGCLRALDYAAGAAFVRSWLDQVLVDDPPPPLADGLWFGLFTAVYEGEEARADLYVHGSRFDPVDGDWACTAIWKPKGSYAHCALLRDVHRIAYPVGSRGLGVDAEYPAVLGFAALAVAAWARAAAAGNAPVARHHRELVVGFDSGDVVHVGGLDATGFRRPRTGLTSVS